MIILTVDTEEQTGNLTGATNTGALLHQYSAVKDMSLRTVYITHLYIYTWDNFFLLKHNLGYIVKYRVPITMLTDPERLIKVLVISTTTTERSLMLDVRATREAFDKNDILDVERIRSTENIAGVMKKPFTCKPLENLLSNE